MSENSIPKYNFNNKSTKLGLEIIPLERILKHSHESNHKAHRLNFYQILIFTKGRGVHEVDFEKIAYSENTVIPIAMGQVQRFSANVQAEGYAVVFTPDFIIKGGGDYQYLYDYTIFTHSLKPISNFANKEVYTLLEEMIAEQSKELQFDTAEFQRNLLKNFLIQIERNKRERVDIICNDSFDTYIQFKKIVEEKISYKLRVSDICETLKVTPKQLNAAIKLYVNTNAKQFMEDRLILEVKRLLGYTTLSIKEIAYEIGFEDPTNFTKYFKSRVNMLPTEYQKTTLKQ
ncbi:helix-turn-helix domain-containing protein [Marinifilum caeruleilacunae]|uniref:AraC family transcriptional regulator n=1 Tax=Marinifilum caeruleilacunae TaxID=2499076 RepID=A0ABX1WR15_9BACT|nr:helix-turn-helix domain-containing protein [Marinifilum caeruleilacunae]NOU58441.1 AraC family transcriptional regulator [Marinifilum caeruleilacunae]